MLSYYSHWLVDLTDYVTLLKTGSLNNAIREFSLAKPSWVMSDYMMLYKYAKRTGDIFLGRFYSLF